MLCKDSRQWFCVEMVSAVMLCGDGECSNVDMEMVSAVMLCGDGE
jgi:hypothetical protein